MRMVLLVASIILFIIAAILDFGLLGTNASHVLGWTGIGLACFAGAHLPLPPP